MGLFLIFSPLPFQLGLHGLLREREAREAAMVRAGGHPAPGGGLHGQSRANGVRSFPWLSPSPLHPPGAVGSCAEQQLPAPFGVHLCPPGRTPCASPLTLQGFSHQIVGVPSWLVTPPTICHHRCQTPGTPILGSGQLPGTRLQTGIPTPNRAGCPRPHRRTPLTWGGCCPRVPTGTCAVTPRPTYGSGSPPSSTCR